MWADSLQKSGLRVTMDRESSFRVGLFYAGTSQQVIDTDIVKIRQLNEYLDGIVQYADLILRIGILFDIEVFCHGFLGIAVVNAQRPNILILHHFISHIITQRKS